MKKIRIGVCDDEKVILGILVDMIKKVMEKVEVQFEVKVFLSGKQMLPEVKSLDLVFLDVEMPGLDGIETGRRIFGINPECKIIIATEGIERFKEAFKINAFRFVTKPFSEEEVEEAIRSYLKINFIGEKISAYYNRVQYDIEQRDIVYLCAYGSYIEIVTEHDIFRKETSLKDMEMLLESKIFFRVHRKYIVNIARIEKYKNGVIFINNKKIEVARRKKKEFERKRIEFDLTSV